MIAALIIAAQVAASLPPPQTAIEAERAFASDAQKLGQWTAFRKWSTPDALMFTPRPVKAHDFLKDRKDPPVAVFWWPGKSYVSCDGKTAINTGPWVREWGKSVGYFTTVWTRHADGGWKWTYDAGDELQIARAEGGDIKQTIASCDGKPTPVSPIGLRAGQMGEGKSSDGTLRWRWTYVSGGPRTFSVMLWDGRAMVRVIDDLIVAPPK